GRVHRYKGHAVRRNLAHSFSSDALAAWQPGNNLWDVLFDLANGEARNQGLSDLIPFWIAPGPYRVERRVPLLPFTSEVAAFSRLKRQLAAYRVVFGQPRQEELLSLLNRADIDTAELSEWSISLQPPESDAITSDNQRFRAERFGWHVGQTEVVKAPSDKDGEKL
ncbi:MAG: hypothetical protein ABR550_12300, partial [Wenzhouxiangellaceae bacterium]